MKKYLLGLAAVIFAIGFSAFELPTQEDFYLFKYDALQGFAKGAVETETNWDIQGVVNPDEYLSNCDLTTQRACEMIVPESSVTASELNFSVDATLNSGTSTYFIQVSSNPEISHAFNKP